jgi:succinate dehydrogenase / fumarate reductase cytochrome b subunit
MELSMQFVRSSIGKKVIMAVSGLVWTGFVFGHMAGNLLMFVSPDLYNAYGHAIVHNKPLLFTAETVLSLALITHVITALLLSKENMDARPVGYAASAQGVKKPTLASQTMKYTGAIVLFFIISHLFTFKYGPEYTTTVSGVEMRDLYKLLVEVFSKPAFAFGYVLCLGLLGMHLKHGVQAAVQSLGFRHPKYTPMIKIAAVVYATVVSLGFIAQPLYIFFAARN